MKKNIWIALGLFVLLALVGGCKRKPTGGPAAFHAGQGCSSYVSRNCQLYVQDLDNPHKTHDPIMVSPGDHITINTHSTDPGEAFVAYFIDAGTACTQGNDPQPVACSPSLATGHLVAPDPPTTPAFQVPVGAAPNTVVAPVGSCFKTVIQKKNGQCVDPHIYVGS